jgi:4-hydroxybenzoate polyprenyltransferase
MRRSHWRSKLVRLFAPVAASDDTVTVQALSPEDRRLVVLLSDYEMGREDDRTLANLQAAFFALATALVAALFSIVKDACQFQDPVITAAQPTSCDRIPDTMLAFAPIVPLVIVGFVQLQGELSVLRSYYLRAVEDELRTYAADEFGTIRGLAPISYVELSTTLTSLRRGRSGYRMLVALLVLAILFVFGGFVVYIASALSGGFQIAMAVFYGSGALFLLADNLYVTVGGRGFFVSMLRKHAKAPRQGGHPVLPGLPQSNPEPERSLPAYLLLPRPEDWVKWLFFPIAWVLALLAGGRSTRLQAIQAGVFFLVLEYLLYEARYQWNDIRGFASDQRHPFRRERRRLPGPTNRARTNITWSAVAAGCRLAAAFLIAYLIPGVSLEILVAVTLVFGLALVYEFLRREARQRVDPFRLTAEAALIWGVVGIGYAVRATFGLYFGLGELEPLILFLLWVVTLWSFGTMVVTLTWALEAAAYCQWTGKRWEYVPYLNRKNHLAALLSYVGLRPQLGPPYPARTVGECGSLWQGTEYLLPGICRFGSPRVVPARLVPSSLTASMRRSGRCSRQPGLGW